MKNVYIVLISFFSISLCGQNTVPNGSFENWSTSSFDELDNYDTQPGFSLFLLGTSTTTRSSDAFNGNFSIRLETKASQSDTVPGVYTSGDFDTENGFPYSQRPDSLVGYYKCDVKAGDSAFLVIRFSEQDSIFSFQTISFVGIQNNWARFSLALDLSMNPDSMFIGATSSNLINEIGIQPGSWLMLDSLHFVGSGITQQIVNGDFENWTTKTFEEPDFWRTTNSATATVGISSATRTTDSHSGSNALRLETIAFFDEDTIGIVTNGEFGDSMVAGGQPFSIAFDTLVGYYKYSPIGLDTAAIGLSFFRNGNLIGNASRFFTAQSTYTEFRVPFVLSQIPDTMRIDIFSSIGENIVGSTLFIDDLRLNSVNTSLDDNFDKIKQLEVYPNPTSDRLIVKFTPLKEEMTISLIDALGREFLSKLISKGQEQVALDLSSLKKGNYFLRMQLGNKTIHRSVVKY